MVTRINLYANELLYWIDVKTYLREKKKDTKSSQKLLALTIDEC